MIKSEYTIWELISGAICVIAPLVVGMLSARLAGDQMRSFGELNQPPLSPPAWLFPVVWTILYILMGITLVLLLKSDSTHRWNVVALFMLQLTLNFFWSPVFFGKQDYFLALIILLAMLATNLALTFTAQHISKYVIVLQLPYILWMAFAIYLNVAVGLLNK